MDSLEVNEGIFPKNSTSLASVLIFTCCSLGMILSITALKLLLFTATVFEEWRKNYKNQLLIQFMVARFLYTFIRYGREVHRFFTKTNCHFQNYYAEIILMAYTEIAVVAWMFVFTKHMYDNFVRVFSAETSLWKVSLAAWTIPIILTIFLFFTSIYNHAAKTKFFTLYLLIFKWPVLFTNGIFLVLILKTILSDNKSKKIKNKRIVVVMIFLIFSFSLQQIAFDAYRYISTVYIEMDDSPLFFKLTSIFTVYQCAVSILFWLFGNKRTRILWGMEKEANIKNQSSITSVSKKIEITKF